MSALWDNRHAWHAGPIVATPATHTMGASLEAYLLLKLPRDVREPAPRARRVVVRGRHATDGHSDRTKRGKLFNVQRPIAATIGRDIVLDCYPGFDYVLHFASVVASYYVIQGRDIETVIEYPEPGACLEAMDRSLMEVDSAPPLVILGKVDFLPGLTASREWQGVGPCRWKAVAGHERSAALLGCTHTIWGEIAGRLVAALCSRGVRTIIYVGKLGSLALEDAPSEAIATGSSSVLPSGDRITWTNAFADAGMPVVKGEHVVVGSVMQESIAWLRTLPSTTRFVDPEIGWMALAAAEYGAQFAYMHIVSDNLVRRERGWDLSNERVDDVRRQRGQLYAHIASYVRRAIAR